MRTVVGILLALVFGVAATPASADEWRDPSGQFSFTFPLSWGVIDPPRPPPREVLAHFGQTTTLVERKECFVDRVPFPRLSGDQASVNTALTGWTGDDALRHIGGTNREAAVTWFENVEVDGVRTITIAFNIGPSRGGARGLSRQFVLVEDGQAIRYGVHCIIVDQGAPTRDVEALLASLHFSLSESTE